MKLDKIHFNPDIVMGYDKDFMSVISSRELGKSTGLWIYTWKLFQEKHQTSIVLRRRIADMSSEYIDDTAKILDKFDIPVELKYKKTGINQGVVDVYARLIGDDKWPKDPGFRVIGMSAPMNRIKSMVIRNPGIMAFDEFICNTRMGETYLPDEVFKFKEIYNTYRREGKDGRLRCIFLGNPYSKWNPYFDWWDVDLTKLTIGSVVSGKNGVVQVAELSDELKEWILAHNPLYEFDDSYTRYAFDAAAPNDANIKLCPQCPESFSLNQVIHKGEKYIGIFRANTQDIADENDGAYWVGYIEYTGKRRRVYAFDFSELIEDTFLFDSSHKLEFYPFKEAIRNRRVLYQNLGCAYLFEDLYGRI